MSYETLTKEDLIETIKAKDYQSVLKNTAIQALPLLEILHYAEKDYGSANSEDNIFHKILDKCLAVSNSEYGFIGELFFPDDEPGYFKVRSITNIAWDKQSTQEYKHILSGEKKFGIAHSLYGQVISTGKPYISNNPKTDRNQHGTPKGHPPLSNFLGLPMYANNQFVGMIGLANRPENYDESVIDDLESLSKIAAIMMLSVKNEDKHNAILSSLQIANEALKTQSEELEQFAYIASHDLKEPLSNIIMMTRLLNKKLELLKNQGHLHTGYILQSATRMQTLIEDLLSYSKSALIKPVMAKVDLNAVLESVQSVLQPVLTSKNVQLTWQPLPTIYGNFAQMEQVFQNLIDNAIKYQHKDSIPAINIYILPNEQTDMHLIHIEDNGIGIQTDNIDDIFMPFKRLHAQHQFAGSGIGLSICKKIMLGHQGDITVTTQQSKGSTFILTLPNHT